jgi:hypothetical protein
MWGKVYYTLNLSGSSLISHKVLLSNDLVRWHTYYQKDSNIALVGTSSNLCGVYSVDALRNLLLSPSRADENK